MRKILMYSGKLLAVLGAVAIVSAAATGCDIDAEFSSPVVIDDIPVNPVDWKIAYKEGRFDYYYADVPLREISPEVFIEGSFRTYWRYGEVRDGVDVDVQEPLPAVMNLARFEGNRWVYYTETLSCSYEVGVIRFMISRSDFFDQRPNETLLFRTVVIFR